MSQGIVFKSEKKKDATKANPRLMENYTVRFPKGYEQFKDSVTVKFRHINAETLSRCFIDDGDGNRTLSHFRIFERCVKEVHGLSKYVTNEDGTEETVELTVDEIVHFEDLRAEADGESAMSIIFIVVHDTAQAILAKSTLTEEEEKNLFADVKQSSQD